MDLQSALASALGGAEPGTGKIEKLTPLSNYIRKIFKDEYKTLKAAKLTWNPNSPPPMGDELTVGLLNKRLAYMGPFGGRFYIQNNQILQSNGVPCAIEDVPDVPYVWTDKHGQRHEAPSDRQAIREALVRFRADALARDPLLCPVCAIERCADQDDRMRHIFKAHPVEFAEMVGLPEAELTDIPVETLPDVPSGPTEPPRRGPGRPRKPVEPQPEG
jgi:hypothetical protein